MSDRQELVRRASIEEIEGHRARALECFASAFASLSAGIEAANRAAGNPPIGFSMDERTAGALTGRTWSRSEPDFRELIRKAVDRRVWSHLIQLTDLERLMDHKARDAFRRELENDPPEATAENALSTITDLMGRTGEIFQRGIATAFSSLDRRFRSHDGFKVGSRVILHHTFNSFGGWAREQDEILRDIERTFYNLDGKPHPERGAGIIGLVSTELHKGGFGMRAFEVEDDYFRLVAYQNGNAHLWFKRPDLVERVNDVLADYYGAALGDGRARKTTSRTRKEPVMTAVSPETMTALRNATFDGHKLILMGQLARPVYAATAKVIEAAGGKWDKRAGAHIFPRDAREALATILESGKVSYRDPLAFFYSPPKVVEEIMELAAVRRGMSVLEPEAGEGHIARAAAKAGAFVYCVEIDTGRARHLVDTMESAGIAGVTCGDFLAMRPGEELERYDRILMNPPFDRGADVEHVMHAVQFLKPGGRLVAVMSAGVEFREDRATREFRALVESMQPHSHGRRGFIDLPAGSFKDAGTMVNACLVVLDAPQSKT